MFGKTNDSAYINFLRAKYEMYKGAVDVTSYPYILTIDPSDICQLRCPTCPTGIEAESRKGKTAEEAIYRSERSMLTGDLFDSLLDEVGEYLFLILFYNYGEPLLNRNLPAFIRKASALNIETETHTNLSLPLSDQYIEDLLTSGLNHLYASIDGFTQPIYEIHRVGGNIELVKNNFVKLAAARDRLRSKTVIHYNYLVFSFNEHEVPEARTFAKALGIEFHTRDAFVHLPSWLPSYRRNEKPITVAEEVAAPPEFSYREDGAILSWNPLPHIDETKAPSRCAWHYGFSVVQPRGEIAPCCAVAKEKFDFGTVVPGHRSFADVWNGDHYKTSRAAFAGHTSDAANGAGTICSRCPLPKFIHHLFSPRDGQVIEQFYSVYRGADPVLKQAFDLMCQSRWGISVDGHQPQVSGLGNEKDTAAFVQFIEENVPSLKPVMH
jgi:MoaA/NifB/PqqE/SkfB family radical SAM enzyme